MRLALSVLLATQLFVGAAIAQTRPSPGAAPINNVATFMPVLNHSLVVQIPKGWRRAHENKDPLNGRYLLEYIPPDQTQHNWREMISVQGFQNLALNPKAHPGDLIKILGGNIQTACKENFVGQLFGDAKIDGADATIALLGCAKMPIDVPGGLKAGESEVALYVSIKGTQDMYLIHRSRRGPGFAANTMQRQKLADWIGPLLPIKLCARGETQAQCLARAAL